MSGIWKRRHGQIFRHRQPKGSETVKAEPTSTAPDLDSTLSRGPAPGLPKILLNFALFNLGLNPVAFRLTTKHTGRSSILFI